MLIEKKISQSGGPKALSSSRAGRGNVLTGIWGRPQKRDTWRHGPSCWLQPEQGGEPHGHVGQLHGLL